eukprot:scaffold166969_cov17-Tisochrysis_lutea.AAC.1
MQQEEEEEQEDQEEKEEEEEEQQEEPEVPQEFMFESEGVIMDPNLYKFAQLCMMMEDARLQVLRAQRGGHYEGLNPDATTYPLCWCDACACKPSSMHRGSPIKPRP